MCISPNTNTRTMVFSCFKKIVTSSPEPVDSRSWKYSNIFDEYDFGDMIGKGGNCEVWSATHKKTKVEVAVKTSKFVRYCHELTNEFEVLRRFDSPHIMNVHFLYSTKITNFLVMQKYESDVFNFIRHYRMSDTMILRFIREVTTGIKCIHDADFIHGDIKPDNIFIDSNGRFIIGDFGAVAHIDRICSRSLRGTPIYMSPELLETLYRPAVGFFSVGKPVDIYAFGQTIYTMLTGSYMFDKVPLRMAFAQRKEVDVWAKIDAIDTTPEMKHLLTCMLDANPVSRATIDEVIEMISNL